MSEYSSRGRTGQGGRGGGRGGRGGGGRGGGGRGSLNAKKGFIVGPKRAVSKDSYLGKAEKIKATLIANAKTKRLFAKTLKQENLTSERLNRSKKGKGKGSALTEDAPGSDDDMAGDEEGSSDDEDEGEEKDDEREQNKAQCLVSSLSSKPKTTPYVHPSRRPASTGALASTSSARGWAASARGTTRGRGSPGRGNIHGGGKERQPLMGDKMDAMLAKIRKGMGEA